MSHPTSGTEMFVDAGRTDKGDGGGNENMKGFSLTVGCDLCASYCRVSIEVCIQFPLQEQTRTQTPHCSPELRVSMPK